MNDIIIEEFDEDLHGKSEDIIKNDMKKEKNIKKQNNKKKNKKRKLNLFSLIISIIWLILIFVNTILIFKYDILPFKYLIIYLLLIFIIPILLIFLVNIKKINKTIKVFISMIGIFYIIILSLTFFYINNTVSFLDYFTSGYNYETKNYMILVLKDSKYSNIKDLDNKKIGYVNPIGYKIEDAIDKLAMKIDSKYEEYKNYNILLSSLDEKEIQAIMVGDSSYQILCEEDEQFNSKYKIIYNFSLTNKIEEIKKDANVTEESFNIYISGIDSYGNVNSLTRSDVNIIASVNPKTNQILLINIPRDYYVEFSGTGKKDKLTHAGIYGIDMSVKTIENLLDIEINYYLRVNYAALVKLVDALGGVNVYSKYSFTSVGTDKNYSYKKGYNYVNGEKALYFVRTRKAFKEGDRARGENQQAMIDAIIKKIVSPSILTNYSNILNSLKGSFITNISTDKITDLVKMQLDTMKNWSITSINLSGYDGSEYTYTYPYQKLYVMIPKESTIDEAKMNLEKLEGN